MTIPVAGKHCVTIDGPAGSGKSTLGRRLALALRLPLVDTGLVYRGVMVAAVRAGVAGNIDALIELARTTRIEIATNPDLPADAQALIVDGVAAGETVREPAHAHLLTTLAQIPEVRASLLDAQRRPAADGGVLVGRDCGTVVAPEAAVKLYLDADAVVREQRRAMQLRRDGRAVDARLLETEVRDRDRNDAPALPPAADAVHINTARYNIEEMVRLALDRCVAAGMATVEKT
ncbi:MAG: (d)CMP kinase [Candidatus Dormibacteria bacterium]